MNEGLRQGLMDLLGSRYADGPSRPVASPANERELALVLRRVRELGAHVHQDLDISRAGMTGVGLLDDTSATLQVGAGVTLHAVETRANAAGLSLGPLTPSALRIDLARFIEGPYAGLRAISGGRLEPVPLSISAMLHDGLTYQSHPSPRSAAGPDLDSLFLGGEGRPGLVTGATLRLLPKPAAARDAAYGFGELPALLSALRAAVASGCWLGNARIEPKGTGFVLGLRALGVSEAVERDLSTLSRCAFARGGRAAAFEAWRELPGPERELSWDELAADPNPPPMALYRLSLESVIARGAGERGLSLEASAQSSVQPEQGRALASILAAIDPQRIFGGST